MTGRPQRARGPALQRQQHLFGGLKALLGVARHGLEGNLIEPNGHIGADARWGHRIAPVAPHLVGLDLAIRQAAGQHLVGDHAQRELIRCGRATLAQEIFRRGVLERARDRIALSPARRLGDAGYLYRAEIDDLRGAGPVDHHILGPEVAMQHLAAMEGAQAARNLLHEAAHRLDDFRGAGLLGVGEPHDLTPRAQLLHGAVAIVVAHGVGEESDR